MRNEPAWDLADCTELRQTLLARPPRVVHGTALLLAGLLGTALVWAGLTPADLVVRAGGRVRPTGSPTKVFIPGRGETPGASFGGRVVAVHFREGAGVRRGDVLLDLDTEQLDNEIAQRERGLRAGEEELRKLARLAGLTAVQFESARAKARAELAQAEQELRLAKSRQAADVRLAAAELEAARDEEARVRRLLAVRAATPAEMVKVRARAREAREKLRKAELPADDGKVAVLRGALELVEKDYAVKREELRIKRAQKETEVEAARTQLANLRLERKQARVRAPHDGVVTSGEVKAGDVLERGRSVVEVAGRGGFQFEVVVPSEEVGQLRVGMPARVKLDAFDYQRYGTVAGTVVFISPDSSVPEGQRAASYVVKIELAEHELRRGELYGRVKLGMAGRAEIVTGQESLLLILLKKVRQTISLG